ncbi:MAG: hypothetical protein JKY54_13425, partial [Flavobacteriales bacterium]|nr:hypothetical protein [Flavobacteriales bacterium]
MSNVFIKYYRSFIRKEDKTIGDPDWACFEEILRTCLHELGHDFNTKIAPLDDYPQHDVIICAHKTKLTNPESAIFYKQMHLSNLFTVDTYGWGPLHSKMKKAPPYHKVDSKKAKDFCQQH